MNIDKTKAMTIVVFALTVVKMVHDFINTGNIDFANADTLTEGVVALAVIVAGYTHHTEVAVALSTPVPTPSKQFKVGDTVVEASVEKGQIKAKKVVKKPITKKK